MKPEDFKQTEESFQRYKENLSSLSQEFELGLFLYLFNKIKWIIVAIILLFTFGAQMYLRYTPEIYKTQALLQVAIKDQPSELSEIYSNSFNPSTNLNAEIELIKSQKSISRLIEKLDLNIFYFSEGEVLTRFLYNSSPFKLENFSVKDTTIISQKIYLNFQDNYFNLTDEKKEKIYAEYIEPNKFFSSKYLSGVISSKVSTKQLKANSPSNKSFFVIPTTKEIKSEIISDLVINIENASAQTIGISHQHTNANFSKDICNGLVEIYMDYDLEKKQLSSAKVVKFINIQKDSVKKRLIDSEKKIRKFRKKNKYKNEEKLIEETSDKIEEIKEELLSVENNIELLSQFDLMFNNNLSSEINSSSIKNITLLTSIFYDDPIIKSMITQLQIDVLKRDQFLKEVTPSNKKVILLNGQIEEKIIYIKKAVVLLKRNYFLKRKKIKNELSIISSENFAIPEKELELLKLEQVKEINNKYYTQLLEKETEYELSKAGITTYNEVLQNAPLSDSPISPNKPLVYVIFISVGLFISIIIVLINYLLHDKITALHEIDKYSKIEISTLGMVPFVKDSMGVSQLIVDKSPKSMLTESFRAIRTNLQFINNDIKSKIIAVSSTISGEGKTFVAINLGGIIAFTGKKVVVIDLDMRKPKIHLALETSNQEGMSEILSKKNTIEDCIKSSSLNNLDFITAGTLPPNPSELILSEVFDKTIEKLKKIYDIIIIDNPPVGLVTDGIPVLQKADYPIYIFKANYSRKNFVQNVEKLIRENNLKKLSVVLNAVDSKRNEYSNRYGYGYGYGYGGYGYGYGIWIRIWIE